MSASPDAQVVYYPRDGGGNAGDFAANVVDVWNNSVKPRLDFSVSFGVYVGDPVPTSVDKNLSAFQNWLDNSGRLSNTGINHIYVIDDPFGHSSHAGTDDIKADQDAIALWNAGKSNARGSENLTYNVGVHEAFHNMMRTIDCPGHDKDNSDDHTCGNVVDDSSTDGSEITPLITTYVNGTGPEAGDSCSGNTNPNTPREYVHEISGCTKYSTEEWMERHF